jgi:hypothetical protein
MRELRANTEVIVVIGPFPDVGDGFTPQVDIDISGTNEAELIKHDSATVVDISGATWAAVTDCRGHYALTLTTGYTDTEGNLRVVVQDDSDCLPVKEDFLVLSEAAYDSKYVAKDTGYMDVNIKHVAESATAATNLEIVYDGVEGFVQAYLGPRGPGVYLNDAAANETTANGVDGTINNPVSTIAAAKTLADSMSLDRIYLVNDTAITLAATMEDYEFIGIGDVAANSINLGTQDVDNSYFEGLLITGAQGGTGRLMAHHCALASLTGFQAMAADCAIVNDIVVSADCYFDKCWSAVAGNGTPTLDINSVADVDISWRHYSGGLQVDNAVSTTTISYESDGQIIVDASCTSLTLTVRGNCSITDSGTTTSLTQEAAVNLTNINVEMVDVMETDTITLPGKVSPSNTPTVHEAMGHLYKNYRNKKDQDATTFQIYDDAGSVVDQTATLSEDTGTLTKTEIVAGA